MYEELYIIDEGKRLKVDLYIPSGITLNFNSNIFGDLSKITCSYTYTFKLPLSANNRRVFDNADDIRTLSTKVRRRLKAEYIQNGIPLFTDANLYIDSTETHFNAVMTWGVINGLENLKDNDIPLNELPDKFGHPLFDNDYQDISAFSNNAQYLKPSYFCGLMNDSANMFFTKVDPMFLLKLSLYYAPPVIPVHKLIQVINEYFGTRFEISNDYGYNDFSDGKWRPTRDDVIFNRGVVPLVNAEWTETQIEEHSISNGYLGYGSNASYCGIKNIFSFNGFGSWIDMQTTFCTFEDSGTIQSANMVTLIKQTYKGGMKYRLDGVISCKLNGVGVGDTPQFRVYCKKYGKNSAEVVASVDGTYTTNGEYVFDFRESNGKNQLSFEYYIFREGGGTDSYEPIFFLGLSHSMENFGSLGNQFRLYYEPVPYENFINLLGDGSCSKYQLIAVRKLPDISCLEFMKSLYYMAGAFPLLKTDGSIGIAYYSDLRDAILEGRCVDWSTKIATFDNMRPSKIGYNVNGFAQHNLYLTKSDKEDSKPSKNEDKYASGVGDIEVNNQTLEKSKTIITLPFNAPFLRSKTSPAISTGDTFKFWEMSSDGKVTCGTAEPICGVIECRTYEDYYGNSHTTMGMSCWNGFANIQDNPSYAYLIRIMQNPIVITENIWLTEIDLQQLDYSIPVYLSKYGAFFAIVSITRDSKGISKCELLKLPEEE